MDDDDFDDELLDDSTLQELEHRAITSTQGTFSTTTLANDSFPKQLQNAPGVKQSVESGNKALPWRPPQPKARIQAQVQTAPPASAPEPPPSSQDYGGFDDEEIINLDEPSMVIQPASGPNSFSRQTSAAPRSRYSSKPPIDPETEAAFAAADAELGAQPQWDAAPHLRPKAQDGIDLSSLQARIAELEAEQARLRQAEQDARDLATAKQGEIAIIRAKQEKERKEFERRQAVMQKLHQDEKAQERAKLDAERKAREKMETDNRFLKHDLADQADRVKRLTGPGKARIAAGKADTPRKTKRQNTLGDGFDDDEVRLVSPSKSTEKSREQTPKAGAKRKRPVQDSPAPPLNFTQPAPVLRQESTEQTTVSADVPQAEINHSSHEDDRYVCLQRMLNHRPHEGAQRTVELLTKHALPSTPSKSLSAMLMDGIYLRPPPKADEPLPLRISRVLLDLWSQCLNEEFYAPVHLLLDMIRFALFLELSPVVSQLVEQAAPLCIKSIDLVSVPIARASTNPTFAASMDKAAHQKLATDIDVDEILDFLQQLCNASSLSDERIEVFWKIDFTFILMMLNKAQPMSQIKVVLSMLSTSCLPSSFGCTHADPEKHAKQERDTIERLTSLIFELPEHPPDEPPYTEEEMQELRIEILKVLKALCMTEYGGMLLAQHRSAIGRLARFLDIQIRKLYAVRPSIGLINEGQDGQEAQHTAHDLVVQTVNTATRILYHLLKTFDAIIDLQQKLSAVHGGYHRFLVSLTRIAFSEQLVLEHGIEDQVVEAAHSILDNVLSPEEGEAIVKAVETPRGTRGTTTRKEYEDGDETASEDEGDAQPMQVEEAAS